MTRRLSFLVQASAVVLAFGLLGTALAHTVTWDDLNDGVADSNHWNGDEHTQIFYMHAKDDYFSMEDQHAGDQETVYAGADNDWGTAGEGPDHVEGQGNGDKQSCGSDCVIVISGGKGADFAGGGGGPDAVAGGLYQDTTYGDDDNDLMYDDDGARDYVKGNAGEDYCDVDLQLDSWDSCYGY